MSKSIIQPEDKRFFVHNPDHEFSPRRNKAVFDETVRSAEKFHREIVEKIDDGLRERMDILNYYGRYRFNQGHKSFEQYVGRKMRDALIGEKILQKIRVMETVNRINGNDKYKNFIQL